MADKTGIEWTDATWNPITGCSEFSEGCRHCYAKRMCNRLKGMHQEKYRNGFEVTTHPSTLEKPLEWKRPRKIFVCSMSDLFHGHVSFAFIQKVFAVMREANHHTFQVLTKRTTLMRTFVDRWMEERWPQNVWLGVTAEKSQYYRRMTDLLEVPAPIRFVSFEPLLGPIRAIPDTLDWVIVGGETGPHAREIKEEWVDSIFEHCQANDIPFFFKRWGNSGDRKYRGRIWEEMPKGGDNG